MYNTINDKPSFNLLTNTNVTVMASQLIDQLVILINFAKALITHTNNLM